MSARTKVLLGMLIVMGAGVFIPLTVAGVEKNCANNSMQIGEIQKGYSVVSEQEICSGLANSDVISLKLRDRSGKMTEFLTYSPAYSFVNKEGLNLEPKVEWIGPKSLKVTIGKVASLGRKTKENINNIEIEIHIDNIMFK